MAVAARLTYAHRAAFEHPSLDDHPSEISTLSIIMIIIVTSLSDYHWNVILYK
jgi:hypothetical protein